MNKNQGDAMSLWSGALTAKSKILLKLSVRNYFTVTRILDMGFEVKYT